REPANTGWVWGSTNPGATTFPATSIRRSARGCRASTSSVVPMSTIRAPSEYTAPSSMIPKSCAASRVRGPSPPRRVSSSAAFTTRRDAGDGGCSPRVGRTLWARPFIRGSPPRGNPPGRRTPSRPRRGSLPRSWRDDRSVRTCSRRPRPRSVWPRNSTREPPAAVALDRPEEILPLVAEDEEAPTGRRGARVDRARASLDLMLHVERLAGDRWRIDPAGERMQRAEGGDRHRGGGPQARAAGHHRSDLDPPRPWDLALLDRFLHVPESRLVERGAVREPFSVGPDEDLGSEVDRGAQGGLAEDDRVLPEEDQLPRSGGGHHRRFFALRLNPAALADFRTPGEPGRQATVQRSVAGLRLDLLHRRVEVPFLDRHFLEGRFVTLRELQGVLT